MNLCTDITNRYLLNHAFYFDVFLNRQRLKILAVYHKHRTIIVCTNISRFETIRRPMNLQYGVMPIPECISRVFNNRG